MAEGQSVLTGVLDSEDTQVMVEAWRKLGLAIVWDQSECVLRIDGCGGQPPIARGDLHIANSGTTIRFLTAALAATNGDYILDGVPRMRERPIGDLLEGLRTLGGSVTSLNAERPNCPPVRVEASGLVGGPTHVAGNVSSQFLSGMMMAAPYAKNPVKIRVTGELVSKPYVDMTAEVMKSFGIETLMQDNTHELTYTIDAPQKYKACQYAIEPDASAASYFLGAAAITGGQIRIEGLSMTALQGDVHFANVLKMMGCRVAAGHDHIELDATGVQLHGIDIDMNSISDTVQTLAAVAVFASGPTRVRGVAHNRHKETDRIGDLACELRKIGAVVEEHEDGLTINPPSTSSMPSVISLETYRDHRMAMSFALLGLKIHGIRIQDPRCSEKTYPHFFEDLGRLIDQAPQYRYS
jgi:3-phosphoshikimate 1-carboxyvinyltransferase